MKDILYSIFFIVSDIMFIVLIATIPIYLVSRVIKWVKFTIRHPKEGVIKAIKFIVAAAIIGTLVFNLGIVILGVVLICIAAKAAAGRR